MHTLTETSIGVRELIPRCTLLIYGKSSKLTIAVTAGGVAAVLAILVDKSNAILGI